MGTHLFARLFRKTDNSDKGYGRTGNAKTAVVVSFIWIVPTLSLLYRHSLIKFHHEEREEHEE